MKTLTLPMDAHLGSGCSGLFEASDFLGLDDVPRYGHHHNALLHNGITAVSIRCMDGIPRLTPADVSNAVDRAAFDLYLLEQPAWHVLQSIGIGFWRYASCSQCQGACYVHAILCKQMLGVCDVTQTATAVTADGQCEEVLVVYPHIAWSSVKQSMAVVLCGVEHLDPNLVKAWTKACQATQQFLRHDDPVASVTHGRRHPDAPANWALQCPHCGSLLPQDRIQSNQVGAGEGGAGGVIQGAPDLMVVPTLQGQPALQGMCRARAQLHDLGV